MKPRILVISNDAGGANLFKSVILAEKNLASWVVMTLEDSPASKIFANMECTEHIVFKEFSPLSETFSPRPDLLIFNPGWNAFPGETIARMKGLECPIAALLDHWIDYGKRLNEDDADYFIVCDKHAFEAASATSLSPLLKLNNYHLMNLESSLPTGKERIEKGNELLFISQTIALHEKLKSENNPGFTYLGIDEEKVVKDLLKNFEEVKKEFKVSAIRFRLHPAETKFRHQDLIESSSVPTFIENSTDKNLTESIKSSAVVMGINSMALYEAHLLGRPTFAIRPYPSTKISIPIPEAQKLNRASEAKRANIAKASSSFYREYPLKDLIKRILPSFA